MNNKGYYAVIPATVRYCRAIPDGAKLLYGEITALSNENGYCWATNKYFADLYGKSIDTIGRWLSELARAGFIYTLVDKESGNSRKIWLAESQGATGKNADRVPAKIKAPYRQKCGDPTGKNASSIKENNTLNNTSNTTTEKADAGNVHSTFKAEKEKPLPPIAPAPLPQSPGAYRPLDIDAEIERLEADYRAKENFQRRVKLPADMFGVYVRDFSLHVQTLEKTYSNVPEFRGHFFNWCDTHKAKQATAPVTDTLKRANPLDTIRRL